MKKLFGTLGVAVLGGIIALAGYKTIVEKPQVIIEKSVEPTLETVRANYTPKVINSSSTPTDFTEAAEKTVNAVVHVKNTAIKTQQNPYAQFFGSNGTRKFEQVGTGSGVIISPDGYIVTNNHVIEGANEIEITLNNRKKLKAVLIGADKNNDIALLKVDADEDLPNLPFGNSDNAKIGEWVLAVGNPYNLTSTVTAGIVSAKGRDLDGNRNIETFIQTDAAVNPGNSGGALVNTRGELVGINTAISSKTGSFIGYSFAVPSNIAKKIVDDLLEFGTVQEALVGISYKEIETGVEITAITEDGGAEKAGLREGDVITKVNDITIGKFSELKGQLTAKRPGDKIAITVLRNGDELEKLVTLSKKDFVEIRDLGLVLKDISKKEQKKFKISQGAKVMSNANRVLRKLGIDRGFIITEINNEEVKNALDAKQKLLNLSNNSSFVIKVINLKGETIRYGF
ncbi:trypsin-like peptidase domain-containing protein [Tenacibaculum sp. S7007]|uniref:Trypsin-like peptidase domain-containing protein n=1 Tax=Tenacibaculum pelagium TaxID=2759527 RepID=A0A839AQS1_9FLAO|nr:trypsin-like peptidase domain-containing protein [Tenacibaculum pelagium]MBA6156589.1 trypsin-like peptidase domain-containing protein [Tenacibaculum pelagium]